MSMGRTYWAVAITLGVGGVALTAIRFSLWSEWFYIGLVMILASGTCINTGCIMRRTRTLDAEFDAGYRVGHRAGRRIARPTLVNLHDRRRDGRLSQAPIREVAGDDPAARRKPAHAH